MYPEEKGDVQIKKGHCLGVLAVFRQALRFLIHSIFSYTKQLCGCQRKYPFINQPNT